MNNTKSVEDFKETYKINNNRKYSCYDSHKFGYLGCSYDGYKFKNDLNSKTGYGYNGNSKKFKKEFKELDEKQNKILDEWMLLNEKGSIDTPESEKLVKNYIKLEKKRMEYGVRDLGYDYDDPNIKKLVNEWYDMNMLDDLKDLNWFT